MPRPSQHAECLSLSKEPALAHLHLPWAEVPHSFLGTEHGVGTPAELPHSSGGTLLAPPAAGPRPHY